MNRKRSISFASLFAAAAFALIPAAAQAWQWYSENVVIPSSPVTPVPVTTKGALTFHVRAPNGAVIGVVKCKLADKEIVVNKAPVGSDELKQFVLSGCKGKYVGCPSNNFAIVAKGLSWFSILITGSNPPGTKSKTWNWKSGAATVPRSARSPERLRRRSLRFLAVSYSSVPARVHLPAHALDARLKSPAKTTSKAHRETSESLPPPRRAHRR
jgi:hypothetical protein